MVSALDSGEQSNLIGGLLGASSNNATISSTKVTSEEAMAILGSRRFLEKFVTDRNILPILFSNSWDQELNDWRNELEEIPTAKDGYELILDSLEVSNDKSLITLEFTFHEKKDVSKILNQLVDDVNNHIRNISINESSENIAFLQQEISKTQLTASKDMLYRLVESQTQSIMIANTRKDYAFKIIDPAMQPEYPAGPNRKLIVIIGTIIGGIFSLFLVLLRNFYNQNKST